MLCHSGSEHSCWPKSRFPNAKKEPHTKLEAVNKSSIDTFGKTTIQIRIGRKTYSHEVIIADIPKPVLGWDFNEKYRLSIIWSEMGDLMIWDRRAQIKAPMTGKNRDTGPNLSGYKLVHNPPQQIASLQAEERAAVGLRSYSEWSQQQTVQANKTAKLIPPPPKYRALMTNTHPY